MPRRSRSRPGSRWTWPPAPTPAVAPTSPTAAKSKTDSSTADATTEDYWSVFPTAIGAGETADTVAKILENRGFARETEESFAAYCEGKPHVGTSLDGLPALPLPLPPRSS